MCVYRPHTNAAAQVRDFGRRSSVRRASSAARPSRPAENSMIQYRLLATIPQGPKSPRDRIAGQNREKRLAIELGTPHIDQIIPAPAETHGARDREHRLSLIVGLTQ